MKYYKEDYKYDDYSWYKILKSNGENLPSEYCDLFDRCGEVSEEYEDLFNCDIYIIKGEVI